MPPTTANVTPSHAAPDKGPRIHHAHQDSRASGDRVAAGKRARDVYDPDQEGLQSDADDHGGDDDRDSDSDNDNSVRMTVAQPESFGNGEEDEIEEITIIDDEDAESKHENVNAPSKVEAEIVDCDEITIVGETKAPVKIEDSALKLEDVKVKVEGKSVIGPTDESFAGDKQLKELRDRVIEQRKLVSDFHRLLNEASKELNSLENQLSERATQLRQAADAAFNWNADSFPWNDTLARELNDVFKIRSFRPLQRESLNATLMRRDVFAILPTGAGKSLIYQLAAVVDRGLTLVVTPLISLSLDQQRALRALNIAAESLDSTTNKGAVNRIYREILPKKGKIGKSKEPRKKRQKVAKKPRARANGSQGNWVQDDMDPSILFVTPEQLVRNKKLMSRVEMMYEAGHLTRFVIDEAHCCSSWGHDFRADYRKLGILKRQCPDIPLVALSATCCPETTSDVCKTLEIPKCVVFRGSIDRPNLFYEARRKKDDEEAVIVDIASMLLNEFEGQCGIVYVLSRTEAEKYSESLNILGIKAGCYHGEMTRLDRNTVHEGWQNGNLQVAVATIAFGLGIDNQRARFVIHATMATSLEGYYQESGRAGRNGKPAKCIVLHRAKDFARLSGFVADKGDGRIRKLYEMYRYVSGRGSEGDSSKVNRCRRAVIAASFGETAPPRKEDDRKMCCDLCAADGEEGMVVTDVTRLAQSSLRIMVHMSTNHGSEKVTLLNLATNWSNKGVKGQRFRGDEPAIDRRISIEIRLEILIELILEGALEEFHRHSSYAVNAYVTTGRNIGEFLHESKRIHVALRKEDAASLSRIIGG